ncbi:MAG: purine-binding chemotaxis protein CheW [Xanthomonadales bacterium]|nr:chemotaxis protein CheW [Gammaproteobacteria bacterium]MBT8054280.1 chemotaxis protein CheW [Gammaproteobacteria bacterium]NND57527.1 purine-binding chemotaxis protein CheW [Xanthomonadales bacterium]NNK51251.1 purine-binding chemotaxis protein CheW [Xanthomonadales bacterium]
MTANGKNTAFAKLLEYEKRSTHFSPGARSGSGPSEEWSGVTFSVGNIRMTCNIDRIGEILPCPQPTPVPGAKPWIIGLANVRGELLTVVDLAWFLTGIRTPLTARNRLLATSLNKAPIGLLIDEVFGQRHFLDSDAVPAELEEDSFLGEVVSKQHNLGNETWQELNLDQLFNSAEFLNGAAE